MTSVLNESIEYIEIESDVETDNESEPPNKMARLNSIEGSSRGSTFTSLTQCSPLTSGQTKSNVFNNISENDENICLNSNEKIINNSNHNKISDKLNDTKDSTLSQTQHKLDSIIANTNAITTTTTQHISNNISDNNTISSNSSKSSDNFHLKEESSHNLDICLNSKTLKTNENKELLIKRLIGLCLENYCRKQFKGFNSEENIELKIKCLTNDSENRNKMFDNFLLNKTNTENKEIQINGRKNSSNSNEDFTIKVKTCSSNNSIETNESMLKKCLIEDNCSTISDSTKIDNSLKLNDNERQTKNGIIKDIFNKNSDNTLDPFNGTVLKTYLTNGSHNCDDNSSKSDGKDPEIVIIDSDEEETNSSTMDVMRNTKNVIIANKYSQSLPQTLPKPKLSLSLVSDDNKTITNEVTLKWWISEKNTEIISKYLIFMSSNSSAINDNNLKPVGCVNAMELPMACTLSNLSPGSYQFFIRAKDKSNRVGPSSNVELVSI